MKQKIYELAGTPVFSFDMDGVIAKWSTDSVSNKMSADEIYTVITSVAEKIAKK